MSITARQCDFLLNGYRNPNTDEPLENGEVYTYIDGSSTTSNLWLDRDKVNIANNPITLDSQGRAEVFGDGNYKFEIYEQRDDDGTIGAHVETLNGLEFLTALQSSEWQVSTWQARVEDISYSSSNSIEIIGNYTEKYHIGRRIQVSGTDTGTIYGTITNTSYDSGTDTTTVTISWDSGGLSDEDLDVSLSILSADNASTPQKKIINNVVYYEDDGSGNIVVDHPNKSAQIANFGITASISEINTLDGITASTAELNIMDGVTATTSEINTVADGNTVRNSHVHSNIALTGGTGIKAIGDLSTNRTVGISDGGVDSTQIAVSAVRQTELKTSSGSVDTSYGDPVDKTLPGGEYGFYPQLKSSSTEYLAWWGYDYKDAKAAWTARTSNTSYATTICICAHTDPHTTYIRQRYVSSSGEIHWFFIQRGVNSKTVMSVWQAPDHPCFGNGGNPEQVPHPFPDFDPDKKVKIDGTLERTEILIINMAPEEFEKEIGQWTEDNQGLEIKDPIEVLQERFDIDDTVEPDMPDKEITIGLPRKAQVVPGKKCKTVKKMIQKPKLKGVRTASLKKKV